MVTQYEAYDLLQRNTFGMKVSCRLYVEVTEPEDLLALDFDALPQPLFVMGGGSNLLFTKDFSGTVLHLCNKGIRRRTEDLPSRLHRRAPPRRSPLRCSPPGRRQSRPASPCNCR